MDNGNAKKKIVFLIDHMGCGGAQELLLNYMRCSRLDEVEFHLVQMSDENVYADALTKANCHYHALGLPYRALLGRFHPRYTRALYRLLKQIKPDILHVQMFFSLMYGVPVGRLLRIPHVIYTVDCSAKQLPWYWNRFAGILFLWTDLVFIFHKDECRRLHVPQRKFREKPACTLFEGNTSGSKAFVWEAQISGKLCCATAGRLTRPKGHQFAIEALALLARKRPELVLLVAGKGPYLDKLRRLAERRGLRERVIFTGYLEDFNRFLDKVDVLLHPAVDEGVNVTCRWAISRGIPVVKFRVKGVTDIFDLEERAVGRYARWRSASDLAARLDEVLADSSFCDAVKSRGPELINRLFDPGKSAEEYDRVFGELLGGAGGGKA